MQEVDRFSSRRPDTGRLVFGAIAGVCGTLAMTVAMRLLARGLAADERYPLPPREIVERMVPRDLPMPMTTEPARQQATMIAHFGYGAAAGAAFAGLAGAGLTGKPNALTGAAYGVAVWAGSYLGWIPGAAVLAPAHHHPGRRNALMIAAHVVWGAVLAGSLRELERADREVFARGAIADRPASAD